MPIASKYCKRRALFNVNAHISQGVKCSTHHYGKAAETVNVAAALDGLKLSKKLSTMNCTGVISVTHHLFVDDGAGQDFAVY
jgi:hypothetical protein